MKCPICTKQARCVDTRHKDELVRRKYKCGACGQRFITLEQLDMVYDDRYVEELRKEHGRAMGRANLATGVRQ